MNDLHYLAATVVDGYRLRYEAVLCQARLRITLAGPALGRRAEVLGSVVALDTDTPALKVSAPLHVEWATRNHERIVTEAVRIWTAVQRDCDG